jgi:hypothetical protein
MRDQDLSSHLHYPCISQAWYILLPENGRGVVHDAMKTRLATSGSLVTRLLSVVLSHGIEKEGVPFLDVRFNPQLLNETADLIDLQIALQIPQCSYCER